MPDPRPGASCLRHRDSCGDGGFDGEFEEAHIARKPTPPSGDAETPRRRASTAAGKPGTPKARSAGTTPRRAAAKPAPGAAKAPARSKSAKPATPKARSAGTTPRRAAAKAGPGAAKAPARSKAEKPAPKAARAAAKPAAPRKPAAKAPAQATGPARTARTTRKAVTAGPDASPAPRRPRRPKPEPDRLEQLVAAARQSLEDDKAEDIVVLDVTGRASFTDRMIVATGLADRQIQAMATHLEEALEKAGLRLRRDAIQASPDWVLIDCGDLVVHLFKPEARATYGLERMWGPGSPAGAEHEG